VRRIVLSKAAIRDRDAIDDYTIEKFGLTQAIRLREAFKTVLDSLLRMPESGRAQPELSPPGRVLRSRSVGSFVIIYEPCDDGIKVARILHGARDLPAELDRDRGEAAE
jgi:plasmid stabilization system protein ParE